MKNPKELTLEELEAQTTVELLPRRLEMHRHHRRAVIVNSFNSTRCFLVNHGEKLLCFA